MSDPRPGQDGGTRPTILVVDDERNIRRTLDLVLRGEGYDVIEAPDAEEGLSILERGERHVDLAILDIMLPGMTGIDLLGRLRQDEATRNLPVIVVSGGASLEDAARAIKLGAADFFEKPLNRDRVLVSVRNALHASRLSREVTALSAQIEPRRELIGESPAMKRILSDLARVAPTRVTVLIRGATGTGKELVSHALHRLSGRSQGPFVKVNCAAIPRELIESELFGHERGAFTGAHGRRRGLFEMAHGGTLFLDEIGDMDAGAQVKVLRALESGEIQRVGGERPIPIDVRVVAATNRDLERAVAEGRFRDDLYFRMAVFLLSIPSLSERPEDVRPLSEALLSAFCRENGLKPRTLSPEAQAALCRRRFPGNIRELRNVIERAAILSDAVITIADLPEDPHESPFADEAREETGNAAATDTAAEAEYPDDLTYAVELAAPLDLPRGTLREVREQAERAYLLDVLNSTEWNVSRAARVLGIERTTLHKRIRAHGIKRSERLAGDPPPQLRDERLIELPEEIPGEPPTD